MSIDDPKKKDDRPDATPPPIFTTTAGNADALAASGFDPFAADILAEIVKTTAREKPVRPVLFYNPEDKERLAEVIGEVFGPLKEAASKLSAAVGNYVGDVPLIESEIVKRGEVLIGVVPVEITRIFSSGFRPYPPYLDAPLTPLKPDGTPLFASKEEEAAFIEKAVENINRRIDAKESIAEETIADEIDEEIERSIDPEKEDG